MRILIMGNCQAESISRLVSAMVSDIDCEYVRLLPATALKLMAGEMRLSDIGMPGKRFEELVHRADLVLVQEGSQLVSIIEKQFPNALEKTRFFPRIAFNGFHPDMIALGEGIVSATGPYHSAIVCYGWLHGLTVDSTMALFREDVFHALGFFEYWDSGVKFLLNAGSLANLPLDSMVESWTKQGVWMYTFNHPKLHVMADLARAILAREGVSFDANVEHLVADELADGAVWSVYPDIAKSLGCDGEYRFMRGGRLRAPDPHVGVFDLEGFIRVTFDRYKQYGQQDLACARLASPRFQRLHKYIGTQSARQNLELSPQVGCSPYEGLPDYQFWRRAVERPAIANVDPVVRGLFRINKRDRIATAGSCFAQHIARTLVRNGFNYFVTESGNDLGLDEGLRRNYGVFSARFGNLYTTRQLLQLFDRAYGRFSPTESEWLRSDGKLVDPFRPQIEPDGFETIEDLERSREAHLMYVRDMFEQLDVFVFTLGLTEAWRNRLDGAVYPLAPSVVAGEMDWEKYEFVNFTASEVASDMQAFVLRLRSVNPNARLILTVSPVPLVATYEDRHVLVSTTYSKAALRVAAEEICQHNSFCAYFPSYEIITGNFTKSEYYDSDLRSVRQAGIDHVMRLFMHHYGAHEDNVSFEDELIRENVAVANIVCDEEAIDT